MKFFSFVAKSICEVAKFCKTLIKIGVVFSLGMFTLTVLMPENMQKALEIFKNLF